MHRTRRHLSVPRGLTAITHHATSAVRDSGVDEGMCHLFVHHTSASLVIQENADPDVCRDLEAFLSRLIPDGHPSFTHVDEGPDDMSAHLKSALTATSLMVPVSGGALDLGRWQGIYLWEHRDRGGRRRLTISVW